MKVKLTIFLILFLLPIQIFGQSKTIEPKDLIGSFYSGHDYASSSITLSSDSTYEIEESTCTSPYYQSGTYFLDSGVLQFSILKYMTGSNLDLKLTTNLLDPEERKKLGYKNPNEIETTFKMIPVKWGNRLYLIDEDILEEFCHAVNFGVEPRNTLYSDEIYISSFYLRKGDENKSVSGFPLVPDKWKPLLLKNPIKAKILNVKNKENNYVATINKGRNDGLEVGIKFIGENELPSLWFGYKVLSVEKNTALVEVSADLKVGDTLTTKFNPKLLDR